MLIGDVADQLHNEDRFADARAAKQADLAALGIWRQQVDNFDARLQNFRRGDDIRKGRGLPVDRQPGHITAKCAISVDGLTNDIEHPPQRRLADGHCDRVARIRRLAAAGHAIGRKQGDTAYAVLPQMLHGLHYNLSALDRHLNGVIDLRQMPIGKLHIHDRADYFSDDTVFHRILLRDLLVISYAPAPTRRRRSRRSPS